MNMKTAISILALTRMLSTAGVVPRARALQEEHTKPETSVSSPRCAAIGSKELTITCAYTAGSDGGSAPRIILDRAVISFVPSNESRMSVEITFTNNSGGNIADPRMVYLAIDDERGENHMRRSLPHVDFTKLEPGRHTKIQEVLLAPAFSPGSYIVSIWIPSTDPSLKSDRAHNFLFSSKGVADPATGLNQIAKFTVADSSRGKSASKPD